MLYQIIGREMWKRIQEHAGLRGGAAQDALEVITGGFDAEWEAANWVYDQGARTVGLAMKESYADAHREE